MAGGAGGKTEKSTGTPSRTSEVAVVPMAETSLDGGGVASGVVADIAMSEDALLREFVVESGEKLEGPTTTLELG